MEKCKLFKIPVGYRKLGPICNCLSKIEGRAVTGGGGDPGEGSG